MLVRQTPRRHEYLNLRTLLALLSYCTPYLSLRDGKGKGTSRFVDTTVHFQKASEATSHHRQSFHFGQPLLPFVELSYTSFPNTPFHLAAWVSGRNAPCRLPLPGYLSRPLQHVDVHESSILPSIRSSPNEGSVRRCCYRSQTA